MMEHNVDCITSNAPHPRFDLISPANAGPALRAALKTAGAQLDQLELNAVPDWKLLMEPLYDLCAPLNYGWGLVQHYLSVMNNEQWRKVEESLQPEIVAFNLRVTQSRPVFDAMETLYKSADDQKLDQAQRRILESALRNARLSGVALDGAEKERFNQIKRELAKLSMSFQNNLLDATKAYGMELSSTDEVEGLPRSLLVMAAEAAKAAGEERANADNGPWRITLEQPSFIPFMKYSKRRDLREKLYRAYITRASSGDVDNSLILENILKLRRELAQLLGYNSYAEISLARKMAGTPVAALELMEKLRSACFDGGRSDFEKLSGYAAGLGGELPLLHWDVAYWSELQRDALFSFSDEMLRPYFPLEKVLAGLFEMVQQLFNVRIHQADGEVPVWHPDVRFFRVTDSEGNSLATFYLDAYSRPETKRGGAWMSPAFSRRRLPDGSVEQPVAYLVCNQSRPSDGKPSLMTPAEVQTLLHEFGHSLQHMLTTVDYPDAAGINNIEWDAVEVCSQFMENWLYEDFARPLLSGHFETGEPLPEELFMQLRQSRTFMAATAMLRQLYFALLDLELHRNDLAGSDAIAGIQARVAEQTLVLQPLPEDRFLCGFSHIFAGGYAAGYYSYKWAEVLAADVFAAFEETGTGSRAALESTGSRFRDTFLAIGGALHPAEVFKQFRGRDPDVAPLLRLHGIEPD